MEEAKSRALKHSRTPTNRDDQRERLVRQSLLSDSTSGIDKGGEDDTTSLNSDTFSSPDLEESNTEVFVHNNINAIEDNESNFKNNVDIPKIKFDDNASSKDYDEPSVAIPDGGWGWMVVFSSFVISMIADGISFSFGLLYMEFLEEFEASKSTTAWIGSLFIAVPLLSGPVMSALVDRYGCRSMTIVGGLVSALGFILASISTTIEMMMITFGVIAGLGLGLVYVTAVVSIAYWFEKKRNLAVGLGACGTGIGTFVYAPLTQYFIEEYGWRGTILLLSGTLLNLCVCGCLMRDPEWWIEEQKKQDGESNSMRRGDGLSRNSSAASIPHSYVFDFGTSQKGISLIGRMQRSSSPDNISNRESDTMRRRENLIKFKNRFCKTNKSESLENIPTFLTYKDKVSKSMLNSLIKTTSKDDMNVKLPEFITETSKTCESENKDDPPVVAYNKEILKRTRSEKYDGRKEKTLGRNYEVRKPNRQCLRKVMSETKDEENILIKQDSKELKDWLVKQLTVNHHYLKDLKIPKNSISHRNAMLNIKGYRLKASSCPNIYKNSMITIHDKENKWHEECKICLCDMFNVSLFKMATFNLFFLATIILFIWFIVPYFYLAEHMTTAGYSEDDGAMMLSLIGITNSIGMIALGWIGDLPKISISGLFACCLILCGVSVASIPAAVSNFWLLGTVSSVFGLSFAASYTFTPTLLVQLVSLDDFTSAYGLVLLAEGIGHLIGPPLSAYMYDVTFSWELSFYLAGGWIIVSGILTSFIDPIRAYNERRERGRRNSNASVA